MRSKDEIRRAMREMRRALSHDEQEAASRAVCRHALDFAPYRQAAAVMAYMACRGELSLAPLMADILESGRTLLLPRCEGPGVMTARRVEDFSQLASGAYGLMEPDAACEIVDPGGIDLILLPGTAFDRAGGRLGQGGGYYDRFLHRTDAHLAGVCHDFALLDAVPIEENDMPVHAVITPQGVWHAQAYRRA